MNILEINFRKATEKDIKFIVKCIIAAEKNNSKIFSYNTIFGLEEKSAYKFISKMLLMKVDGCELSITSYIIATFKKKPIGAMGAWIEPIEGIPSKTIKGNLLFKVVPKENLLKSRNILNLLNQLYIDYVKDSMCVGITYIDERYRGLGILKMLLDKQAKKLFSNNGKKDVYVQVFSNNTQAIKAYEKLGFLTIKISETKNENILKYLPSNKKFLMKKMNSNE